MPGDSSLTGEASSQGKHARATGVVGTSHKSANLELAVAVGNIGLVRKNVCSLPGEKAPHLSRHLSVP